MHLVETFRIFLSSPRDVADDRAKARELLLGLARGPFVRDLVHIDVVSWDDLSAPATMDFRATPKQAVDRSLPTPADCDLTVVLLWGQMGTPLTENRPDGTPYLSGTEWEFENALAANKPVMIYRRSEKVQLDVDDPQFDEKLAQKRRMDAFFGRRERYLFYRTYNSTAELLDRLRGDVESFLTQLEQRGEPVDEATPRTEPHAVDSRVGTKQASQKASGTTVFICYRREDSQGGRATARSPHRCLRPGPGLHGYRQRAARH